MHSFMAERKNKDRLIATLSKCEDIKDLDTFLKDLSIIKPQFNQDLDKNRLLSLMNAFGNPDRFLILDSLRSRSRCVCELESIIDKSQPAVSHHLKLLERMQLIRGWKKGKFTYYSLVEKTFQDFVSLWKEWNGGISNWFGK